MLARALHVRRHLSTWLGLMFEVCFRDSLYEDVACKCTHACIRGRALKGNTHIQRVIKQCNGRSDILTPPFLRMNSHSQLTGTDVMFLLSQLSSALQGVSRRFDRFTHTHTHTHRCRCFTHTSNARLHLKGEWKARTFVNNPHHEF